MAGDTRAEPPAVAHPYLRRVLPVHRLDVLPGRQRLRLFAQAKGGGNANHNQPTVTCTQSETGVLGDFLNPGDTPPPGTSVSDPVTFTLTVTAVRHS